MITDEHDTRKRLISEGLRLFAEKGYAATTVGDIERAAGLAPRRGGMYRHFVSKQEVLQVAVERHVDEARDLSAVQLPADTTLRASLLQLAQALVVFMEHTRDVSLVLEREGTRVPELRDRFRTGVIEVGYRRTAELIAPHLGDRRDADALAVVLMGAVVSYLRAQWTFEARPLDVERDQFLDVWVDAAERSVTGRDSQRP